MNHLDLLPFRRLLDRPVDDARPYVRRMIGSMAVPLALVTGAASFAQIFGLREMFVGSGDVTQAAVLIASGTILLLVMLLLYGLVSAVATVAALDALGGRSFDMWRSWRFVLRPAVLGTMALVWVVCILSFMMCMVPALWVVPLLSLTLPVMVEEDVYGATAIKRSLQLASFNGSGRWRDSSWLQLLVFIFVCWILQNGASLFIQAPFAIVQQYSIARGAAEGQTDPIELMVGNVWLQVLPQALGAVVIAAVFIYGGFGLAALFHSIRRRREGTDLAAAIDSLGTPERLT